jgi:hypothetical protein
MPQSVMASPADFAGRGHPNVQKNAVCGLFWITTSAKSGLLVMTA